MIYTAQSSCNLPSDHPLRNLIGNIINVTLDEYFINLYYEDGREMSFWPDENGDMVLWTKDETKN